MSKVLDANKVLKHQRVKFNRTLVKAELRPSDRIGTDVPIVEITRACWSKFKKGLDAAVAASRREHNRD